MLPITLLSFQNLPKHFHHILFEYSFKKLCKSFNQFVENVIFMEICQYIFKRWFKCKTYNDMYIHTVCMWKHRIIDDSIYTLYECNAQWKLSTPLFLTYSKKNGVTRLFNDFLRHFIFHFLRFSLLHLHLLSWRKALFFWQIPFNSALFIILI